MNLSLSNVFHARESYIIRPCLKRKKKKSNLTTLLFDIILTNTSSIWVVKSYLFPRPFLPSNPSPIPLIAFFLNHDLFFY